MRISEQLDAMSTLAVEPVQYLVAPRLIACTLAMPVLTMVYNVCGMMGAYVFVVHPDSMAERRFIEVGGRYGSLIIVNQGVAAGERVIVEGMHKVQHRERVEVVDPEQEGKTDGSGEEEISS